MRRVAPSVTAGEQPQELLPGSSNREANIVSALLDRAIRLVEQELVEVSSGISSVAGPAANGALRIRSAHTTVTSGRLRTSEGFIDHAGAAAAESTETPSSTR